MKTIKPDDAVLYTLDTSLPVGTRKAGRKKRMGYVVDTYKVYKDADGNVAERQKLWTTTYRAMQVKFCITTVPARRRNEPKRNEGNGLEKGGRAARRIARRS